MTDKDNERFEKNFEAIFSKLNKMLPANIFIAVMTTIVIVGGSLFGLMYSDLQSFKAISTTAATEQRVEVIKEIGELKTLIEKINK